MKTFLIYRLDTGDIISRMATPIMYGQDLPPGCWVKEGDADMALWKMNVSANPFNPTLVPLPPPEVATITSAQINAVRNRLEQAPVLGFDFDAQSEIRMRDAVEQWDFVTYTKSAGMIGWKDAANEVRFLTKDGLAALLSDLKRERAMRADRLHAHARDLIERLPNVTRDQLSETNWPMNP